MKRVLPAASSAMFAAFSDPDKLAKWWGPEGFTVPNLEFDPHVGASYRIEMQPSQGDPFYLTGEFREVDPLVRLAFTFVYEDPDPDDVDTLVELSFRDLGKSTEVVYTQGPLQDGSTPRASPGWLDGQFRQTRAIHLEAITTRQSPTPQPVPGAMRQTTVGGAERRAAEFA